MRRLWFAVPVGLVWLAVGGPGAAFGAPASTTSTAGATTTTTTTTRTLSTTEFEARLVRRTNVRRLAVGCRALRWNAPLTLAARRHSARMSDRRVLSHRLSNEAGLGARATRAGYTHWRLLAENLAWGQSSPAAVLRAWVASPPHRANLDDCRLRDVGFGVVYRNGHPWVTADFGHRVA